MKLNPGDRVALIMKNSPEVIEIIFGAWQAGLCVVPINSKLHPREFGFILENSGAKACFYKELSEAVSDARSDTAGLEHLIETSSDEYFSLKNSNEIAENEAKPTDLAWLFTLRGLPVAQKVQCSRIETFIL